MQTVQVEVLEPEEQARKHARIMSENERRDRERVAAANRAAGHKKPEPGDLLYVTTMRGISRRGRGGVRFMQEARTTLIVVADLANPGDVPSGFTPVTVDSAEAILADDALNVSSKPATDAEAASLRSQVEGLSHENAELKAELEKLRREARQAALPDPAGGPARLNAARKVKTPDPDGFGGKD